MGLGVMRGGRSLGKACSMRAVDRLPMPSRASWACGRKWEKGQRGLGQKSEPGGSHFSEQRQDVQSHRRRRASHSKPRRPKNNPWGWPTGTDAEAKSSPHLVGSAASTPLARPQ